MRGGYLNLLGNVGLPSSGGGGELTYVALTGSGSGTWTVPPGVTEITVECWGAGGEGTYPSGNYKSGGAGGGGAYAKSTITVSPSSTINYYIGYSHKDANNSQTYFVNKTTVKAAGGTSASTYSTYGGNGGLASNSVGEIKFSGGDGGNGSTYYSNPAYPGLGGMSAGPCGDGLDGPDENGSYPSPPTCELATNAGGMNDYSGEYVKTPGRGGNGRNSASSQLVGGDGQIRISYYV